MNRREFNLSAAAATAVLATPALAQTPPTADTAVPDPYKQITPQVEGEMNKVHAVIAFTCPVCAHYHGILSGWGKSLPRQFAFNFIPSVTDRDSMALAMAWLAMQKASPDKLDALANSLYTAVQVKSLVISAPDGAFWKSVMRDVGSAPGFGAALRSITPADIATLSRKTSSFQITATPSVVVCGKYVITPDHANGDESLFVQLASGMVSKYM